MAKGLNSSINGTNRKIVLSRESCEYCEITLADFHIDHFIPPRRGGDSSLKNLKKACVRCNCSKSDRLPLEWFNHIKIKRDFLYNKMYGYASQLRIRRKERILKVDFINWLTNKIFLGRKEHSRYTKILYNLNTFCDGQTN